METASTTQPPVAGPLRRLMALFYDLLLLLGVSFGYGVLVLLVRKMAGDNTMEPLQGIAAMLEITGLVVSYCGYYCWCWLKKGQTLAMKSWRMELQMSSGARPSPKACYYRCLLAPLCIAAGGIGYWWCWFDGKGDALQDRLTGTRVVVLPKNSR